MAEPIHGRAYIREVMKPTRMKLVLIGPQGSGKGTQAQLLSSQYKIPHISTGQLFRDAADRKLPLGLEAKKKYWGRGGLVPDRITIALVQETLKPLSGFVLDGFPRTIKQAQALEKIANINAVIELQLTDAQALERLASRKQCTCGQIYGLNHRERVKGICDSCGKKLFQREDDTLAAIKKRLATHHKETAPILDYYRKKNLLVSVDASGSVEQIFAAIKSVLKKTS